jgi:hypothetical protein
MGVEPPSSLWVNGNVGYKHYFYDENSFH